MLIERETVGKRWTEYYERLLNIEDHVESVIVAVVR